MHRTDTPDTGAAPSRAAPKTPHRAWRCALGAALVALLAACGGGSSQVEPFAPTRVLAFGDELNLLLPDGRNFGVNFINDEGEFECAGQAVWTQYVARSFDLAFPECNPDDLPADSQMLAQEGATIADFEAQVQDYTDNGGSFGSKDLVTVLVGMHDVLELYGRFPAESRSSLIAQARDRGEAWARRMNAIAEAGGRVMVVNSPDIGLTPFALAEKAANTDIDRALFLTDLTKAMNLRMASTIIPDGRLFGIVFADDITRVAVRAPSVYGMVNATDAVCATAPPDCTNETLITVDEDANEPTANNYLWADDLRLSAGGQAQIGISAVDRIATLPF